MKTLFISSAFTAFISLTAHASCTTVPVTFKITDITAAADTEMFVNGNQSALGQWSARPTNQIAKDAASQMWTGTLQLPPATRFQFKFFKRSSAKSGAKEIWETGIATYSENREAITPACGTKDFTIDSGDFRQAEQPHNPFRDNLSPPQGKKGERLQALVETINANSPAVTRTFVAAHLTPAFAKSVPIDVFEAAFAKRFAQTGGVDLRGQRSYILPQPDTTALLQDRLTSNWLAAFVVFDDAADSRIGAIGMLAAHAPRQLAVKQENTTPIAPTLQTERK